MSSIRRRSSFAALSAALAAACGPALAAGPAKAQTAEPLRLCADPSNLPFSSDDPAKPGLYLEIGEALGKALGRPVTHVWYKTYFGKRAVRVTMLSKQCDAMIGLPKADDFMGPRVIFSKPLFRIGYALVAPKNFAFTGLDSLKGKRIAVQFASTPQSILALRDDIESVTVMSPDEGVKKLDEGKVDAAFVWGPTAGYLNQTAYAGKFAIIGTDGPGLTWSAAIGFPKGSDDLKQKVDAAIPGLEGGFGALLQKYGFPTNAPVKFGAAATARPVRVAALGEGAFRLAQAGSTSSPATQEAAKPAGAKPTAADVAEGKEVFNGTCAHCHGPDAVQSEKKIDLRRLTIKYGADAHGTYWTTVHKGRPAKGMPSWKDVFTDDQLNKVWDYLQTVQKTSD